MKLTQLIAVAALLNASVDEVAAIRRHHHHHNHFVQLNKEGDDILKKDPKFAELQAKKVALKNELESLTTPKELTEEEEKAKFDKEVAGLEREGKVVNAKAKIADAKKSLAKVEADEKESGDKQEGKKEALKKMIEENTATVESLKTEGTQADAEPAQEESEKVKDLKKSIKDVEAKQATEEKKLMTVAEKLHDLIDPKVKEPNYTSNTEEKPKPDLSAFKKNLAKIEKEEEEKEEIIEARKATQAAYPKNPAVEISEKAEEEAMQRAYNKAKEDEAAEEAEAAAKAKKLAEKAKAAEQKRDKAIGASAELWTANMPEQYLEGYIQTQVNDIRHQLAQVEMRENQRAYDSDSDSSDSDSDDE